MIYESAFIGRCKATIYQSGRFDSAFRAYNIEKVLVNCGQHYDANMSDVFFNELQISPGKYNLVIGTLQ